MSINISENISKNQTKEDTNNQKINENKATEKPEKFKLIIGERLKLVREANGHRTRAGLKLKNINVEYFAKVENGQHSIAVDTLYVICKEFNISMSEFMLDIDIDIEKNIALNTDEKIIINSGFKKMLIDKYSN